MRLLQNGYVSFTCCRRALWGSFNLYGRIHDGYVARKAAIYKKISFAQSLRKEICVGSLKIPICQTCNEVKCVSAAFDHHVNYSDSQNTYPRKVNGPRRKPQCGPKLRLDSSQASRSVLATSRTPVDHKGQ